MTQEEIEKRVERAKELFHQGYNCSQSVVASCADLFGMDEALALRMSASFGGGIGRMRQTCGAACGMFMLEGLVSGSATPDAQAKANNYAQVQELAQRFREQHGSIICAELLGLAQPTITPTPEARTSEYYHKRPCAEMVGDAVRIFLMQNARPMA